MTNKLDIDISLRKGLDALLGVIKKENTQLGKKINDKLEGVLVRSADHHHTFQAVGKSLKVGDNLYIPVFDGATIYNIGLKDPNHQWTPVPFIYGFKETSGYKIIRSDAGYVFDLTPYWDVADGNFIHIPKDDEWVFKIEEGPSEAATNGALSIRSYVSGVLGNMRAKIQLHVNIDLLHGDCTFTVKSRSHISSSDTMTIKLIDCRLKNFPLLIQHLETNTLTPHMYLGNIDKCIGPAIPIMQYHTFSKVNIVGWTTVNNMFGNMFFKRGEIQRGLHIPRIKSYNKTLTSQPMEPVWAVNNYNDPITSHTFSVVEKITVYDGETPYVWENTEFKKRKEAYAKRAREFINSLKLRISTDKLANLIYTIDCDGFDDFEVQYTDLTIQPSLGNISMDINVLGERYVSNEVRTHPQKADKPFIVINTSPRYTTTYPTIRSNMSFKIVLKFFDVTITRDIILPNKDNVIVAINNIRFMMSNRTNVAMEVRDNKLTLMVIGVRGAMDMPLGTWHAIIKFKPELLYDDIFVGLDTQYIDMDKHTIRVPIQTHQSGANIILRTVLDVKKERVYNVTAGILSFAICGHGVTYDYVVS